MRLAPTWRSRAKCSVPTGRLEADTLDQTGRERQKTPKRRGKDDGSLWEPGVRNNLPPCALRTEQEPNPGGFVSARRNLQMPMKENEVSRMAFKH
ncbi:unnamed protein product [Rangifer tarandus platyrhynchus]|uniref:Uncharacterized protein n=1 Tax=Rangifer tarandus platyrhynchus TaxID=3082113 RepID=A0AC60A2Y1_RANTA